MIQHWHCSDAYEDAQRTTAVEMPWFAFGFLYLHVCCPLMHKKLKIGCRWFGPVSIWYTDTPPPDLQTCIWFHYFSVHKLHPSRSCKCHLTDCNPPVAVSGVWLFLRYLQMLTGSTRLQEEAGWRAEENVTLTSLALHCSQPSNPLLVCASCFQIHWSNQTHETVIGGLQSRTR